MRKGKVTLSVWECWLKCGSTPSQLARQPGRCITVPTDQWSTHTDLYLCVPDFQNSTNWHLEVCVISVCLSVLPFHNGHVKHSVSLWLRYGVTSAWPATLTHSFADGDTHKEHGHEKWNSPDFFPSAFTLKMNYKRDKSLMWVNASAKHLSAKKFF